jgi:hypothetical protein
MNTFSIRGRALPAATLLLALIAVVAVVASGALGRAGNLPQPTPSPSPSGSPTSTPAPTPTAEPSAEPSDEPADGVFDVDLDTVDDHDVSVVVDDATGSIVKVSSGSPVDGMSVRWSDMKIENVDATTLRLTWVGLPLDEQINLFVADVDGKLSLRFVQAAPPPYSDAMGYDRILVVTFDGPVSADHVEFSFEEASA